jgi:peptide-methionine (R)-S-oxide reductase
MKKVEKSDSEWRQSLSEEQYQVLRRAGTERPFSGSLLNVKEKGEFRCAGCGAPLFESKTKFDSGSGWPSFTAPMAKDSVQEQVDQSHGMSRTEVRCAACEGHLGHVFPDGPGPGGLRYCINSAALDFRKDDGSGEAK